MRFVSVKRVEQQDIQAAHRVRSELMKRRTAKAQQIRGLVSEYGLVAPIRLAALRTAIPRWLEDAENGLTSRFRALVHGLWRDLTGLDDRVAELTGEIEAIAKADPVAQRLQQLRGVGPLVATALLANSIRRVARWRPPWGSHPGNTAPAARIACWVSVNAGMGICAAY